MIDNDDRLLRDIKKTLDQSNAVLDGDTLARLRQARHQALDAAETRRSPFVLWGPVTAMASVAMLSLSLWLYQAESAPVNMMAGLEDIELLAANEDIDFYENLDFYLWLEGQEERG